MEIKGPYPSCNRSVDQTKPNQGNLKCCGFLVPLVVGNQQVIWKCSHCDHVIKL